MDTREAQGRPPEPGRTTNEHDRVEAWRLSQLLDAGYPLRTAERIAAADIDLHRAIDLLEQGCKPALAARILL